MSEVEARPPPRGRSSTRGGRGGFGRGGPRGGRKPANGTANDLAQLEDSLDDQGELGEMKKKYSSELGMLKDMFPDWTDVDLVFALQETEGDVPSTVDKITQGNVSQFSEVKKTKDRARSKVKEEPAAAGAPDKPTTRGGRGRGGFEGARGGRGRGSDRGRGGSRGGRGGHATTNGTQKEAGVTSVPTTESSAWGDSTATEAANGSWDNTTAEATKEATTGGNDVAQSQWGKTTTAEATPAPAPEGVKSSVIPEGGPKKSWASMFSQPKQAPAVPAVKHIPPSQPPPTEPAASGEGPLAEEQGQEEAQETLAPPTIEEPVADMNLEPSPLEAPSTSEGEELSLTPSKDPLTEANVEHLPDESHPPATQTVASTTGSLDPRNLTPLPASQQAPIGRPPVGGYAATAYRATGATARSASFQRRVQEQQQAVVMPGHNAVDRAAVQFGSMGLNGEPGMDVDEDREEPETRQAPQHSPPSQPRASLPPVPRQTTATHEAGIAEGFPTPKQAPGLPPASQQNQQQMQDATMAPGLTQDQAQMNPNNPYGRYGQPGMQPEAGGLPPKPYDPFSHQAQSAQYDQYGAHAQQVSHHQQQQQSQSGFGGLSAQNDFSSPYTSDQQQQRNAYNPFFGAGYGPQDVRSQVTGHQGHQQDVVGPQRSASGFGAGPNESAGFSSQAQQQAQSRFNDPAPGSGNNTPNPLMGAAHQPQQNAQQQGQHAQSMHQQGPGGHQQQAAGGYGAAGAASGFHYGHPYYNSPYPQAYQNQFGYQHQVGGYGGGFPSKQGAGMYGGPQGYGMGSHSSAYDQHSSSPANAGAFGQNQQGSMRSTSGMGSGLGGLDEYGRQSAQQSGTHQQGSGAFGGVNDPFARSASGFGAAGQGGYGQQTMGAGGNPEDSLKPLGDSKNGPSPAFGQPGRPGSATNSAGGSTGLPPPQSQGQSGFGGGYPGFSNQAGTQYGGLGGLGNHQQGGGQATGGYGAAYGGGGGFGQTYGGYASRGWGSNYTGH